MKKNKISVFLSFLLIVSCVAGKPNKPYQNVNTNQNSWLFFYIERNNEGAQTMDKVWMIADDNMLSSLKEEYQCNEKAEGDGDHEFIFYLYKDNTLYKHHVFSKRSHFSLGESQKQLQKVTSCNLACKNVQSAQFKSDSLNKIGVPNIYSKLKDCSFANTYYDKSIPVDSAAYIVVYFKKE